MKMYSGSEVKYIVQEFLAKHFNFDYVNLNISSVMELKEICDNYGMDIPNIEEN